MASAILCVSSFFFTALPRPALADLAKDLLRKRDGVIDWPARFALAPYLIGARVSAWLQNRGRPALLRVAEMLPPCASTIERLMERPMPMPSGLVV